MKDRFWDRLGKMLFDHFWNLLGCGIYYYGVHMKIDITL